MCQGVKSSLAWSLLPYGGDYFLAAWQNMALGMANTHAQCPEPQA